jgi:hypothetical protein
MAAARQVLGELTRIISAQIVWHVFGTYQNR